MAIADCVRLTASAPALSSVAIDWGWQHWLGRWADRFKERWAVTIVAAHPNAFNRDLQNARCRDSSAPPLAATTRIFSSPEPTMLFFLPTIQMAARAAVTAAGVQMTTAEQHYFRARGTKNGDGSRPRRYRGTRRDSSGTLGVIGCRRYSIWGMPTIPRRMQPRHG